MPRSPRPYLRSANSATAGKRVGTYFVLRHGETPLNDPNDPLYPGEQLRGDTDFPLNDAGKQQARNAGALLAGRGIVEIVSSQLQRTVETALIVQTILDVPLSIDSGLDTWSLGLYSGLQVTPELEAQIDWYEAHPDERVPGGETFNDFLDRVERTITRYEQLPGPLLLVTHGRILYSLEHVRSARTAPISEDGPPPGSVIEVHTGVPGYSVVRPPSHLAPSLTAVEHIQRTSAGG
jgi:broad specificity phosphatase PhoE